MKWLFTEHKRGGYVCPVFAMLMPKSHWPNANGVFAHDKAAKPCIYVLTDLIFLTTPLPIPVFTEEEAEA